MPLLSLIRRGAAAHGRPLRLFSSGRIQQRTGRPLAYLQHRNFVTQADDSEHEDEDSKHGRNQINDFSSFENRLSSFENRIFRVENSVLKTAEEIGAINGKIGTIEWQLGILLAIGLGGSGSILLATARPSHRPIGRLVDQLASFLGGPASQGDQMFVRTTDQIFVR